MIGLLLADRFYETIFLITGMATYKMEGGQRFQGL